MATFGERFRELRNAKNLTQEELRKDFNAKYHYSFTLAAISQYENDKRTPEIDALKSFADYFNVTLDYLIGRSDVSNPYKSEAKPEPIKSAENLYRVDPDMLIQMCRATDLPEQERQKIKEYSALLIEKFLREKAEKEKQHDK